MKHFKVLTILLSSVIFFYACNDNTKSSKQENIKPTEVLNSATLPSAPTTLPAATEPAQNTDGVWHYTCIKGCSGGAGAAVNCPNCGVLLTHNSAYHSNANSVQSSSPFASSIATPSGAEPSQNAAGVWHYTCGKGCAGGSGAAGNCGTCGGSLAHNVAYHQ